MLNDSKSEEPKKTTAIVLAGGLGTRLLSVVKDLPKCMAPVNGKPFLSFVMAQLQKNGIEKVIFSLGHKSDIIIDFLESNYPSLDKKYVVEKEPLGTGGAIKAACKYVSCKDVVIVNGDTFFNIDINKLVLFHQDNLADCTLALKLLKNTGRYGTVVINSKGLIKSFTEKNQALQGYINGGIYVLHVNSFLNEPLPAKFSFEKDYLEKNTRVKKIYGVRNNKYFIDIGIPEDYERANAQFVNLKMGGRQL
jgi:D-glycero-alpha-D-manno-heptose 1-phosphate guanylyltransferase